MTYNRDLQEDKERLFDTADTVRATTRLMAAMLQNTKINRAACAAAASDPTLLATDLADYLVRKGMPFRQAHHAVGAVVALSEILDKPLNRLTLAQLQSVDKKFGRDALGVFHLQRAMAKRNLTGAPGTKEVAKQLARWRNSFREMNDKENDSLKACRFLLKIGGVIFVVYLISILSCLPGWMQSAHPFCKAGAIFTSKPFGREYG